VRKVPVVEIEGVQEQTVAAFLRYVYTDEVEIDLGTHPPSREFVATSQLTTHHQSPVR
jgi:hypothetical protein